MLAPAKINLYLHVAGKLDNGYHTLDSLMIPVDVCDKVVVEPSEELCVEVVDNYNSNPSADFSKDNIVIKAAEMLAKEAGLKNSGARIKLIKNIPIAAGMGGGSADAAATLKLLNDLWALGLSEKELIIIASKIGADVPFCIKNTPAFISGIGEVVEDVVDSLPPMHILLVNPRVSLSTADAFKLGDFNFKAKGERNNIPLDFDGFINYLSAQENDLEKNAIRLVPEIKNVLEVINNQNGCNLARMSGSGATCFGIFKNYDKMNNAIEKVRALNPGWWIKGVKYA